MNNTETSTNTDPKPMILAIETSCDETAISLLQGFRAVSHKVHSQADLHAEFGGVFPNLAKREHGKNFTALLDAVLREGLDLNFDITDTNTSSDLSANIDLTKINEILSREHELQTALVEYLKCLSANKESLRKVKENINAIAVTYGPGLEPALWVGISAAKALATAFDLPLYPINHMEGHIASVLADSEAETDSKNNGHKTEFPAIALLISGGHTELVTVNSWHDYKILGQTVDDAVGEAYDKTARLIGLPYPGGPAISALASKWRANKNQGENVSGNKDQKNNSNQIPEKIFNLPRPMLHSKDFNFSFSGLKTAVLYAVRNRLKELNQEELSEPEKIELAGEFEEAVIEVLIAKTKRAIEETGAKTLIIGGGVIANTYVREKFKTLTENLGIELLIPEINLATDNASMIGLVATLQIMDNKKGLIPGSAEFGELKADGNLRF